MANKIRDYTKLAADICAAVGKDNILSATHCATRLRLVLRETPSDEVTKQISEMPAVIKVMESGGQYQVVIGTHAKDVYEALAQLLDLDNSTAAAPEVKQGLGSRIIATMSAVFAPFVYILAAAGLVQGALIIITHFFPAFAATGTYSVLSFISWTPFTFLPVMIAVTASKHFKCNTFIAMWCCMALVNPDWASIAARIADGEVIKFLAFPMRPDHLHLHRAAAAVPGAGAQLAGALAGRASARHHQGAGCALYLHHCYGSPDYSGHRPGVQCAGKRHCCCLQLPCQQRSRTGRHSGGRHLAGVRHLRRALGRHSHVPCQLCQLRLRFLSGIPDLRRHRTGCCLLRRVPQDQKRPTSRTFPCPLA